MQRIQRIDREKGEIPLYQLEDSAGQVLWDLQSGDAVFYKKLRLMLVQAHRSRGQAEIYRTQLKMVRRKKGESLTDLVQEICRITLLAFPEPTDPTTDIVARDVVIEARDDSNLVTQVQAHGQTKLDCALQVAQHMEVVMKTVITTSSKPVRAVVQGTGDPLVEAELSDLKAGQRHLLELLQQLARPEQVSQGSNSGGGAERQRPPAAVTDRNSVRGGTGTIGERSLKANSVCFCCEREGHFARNCDQPKPPAAYEGERTATPAADAKTTPMQNSNSVRSRGIAGRRVYLEILLNGKPIDCLLDPGSEVTLIPGYLAQELPKRPVTSQIRAANGMLI